MTEFEIIRRYFAGQILHRDDVVVGIGDDGAVIKVPPGYELVTVVDTLVAGVHFPLDALPEDIGHKSLAVNLSDIAAMGAEPAWATLALTLPHCDETWLGSFAQGFFRLAEFHGVQLIGGDTTRGPLTVTVQVQGLVPIGKAVRRSGARPGDLICVTGTIGDAGLALWILKQHKGFLPAQTDYLFSRLHRPKPRVAETAAIRDLCTAMIDVSDGLAADLNHILEVSGVGACLNLADIPLSAAFSAVVRDSAEFTEPDSALRLALGAGDDYELCFTIPADRQASLARAMAPFPDGHRVIGVIEPEAGLRMRRTDGTFLSLNRAGYDHFDAKKHRDMPS